MVTKQVKIKGFTLIEMLAVIAIIGILAGLLIPAASKARKEAAIRKAQVTISALETALSMYYTDYGAFPPSCTLSTTQANGNTYSATQPLSGTNLVGALSAPTKGGPYMKFRNEDLIKDPSSSRLILKDPWGRAYIYVSRSSLGSGVTGIGPFWSNTTDVTKNTYNIYSFGPDGTTETTGGTDVTDTNSSNAFNSSYCGNDDRYDGSPLYDKNDDDINNW